MKTPKKKQLYDVCIMANDLPAKLHLSSKKDASQVEYTVRHAATIKYAVPITIAKHYVRIYPKSKSAFAMYVKNGLNPVQVLLERKAKAEIRRQNKMHDIAMKELENSYAEDAFIAELEDENNKSKQ